MSSLTLGLCVERLPASVVPQPDPPDLENFDAQAELRNNINRVLPKGKILPIPLLCEVRIGEVIKKLPDEDKTAFLTRIRQALLDLAPQEAK